jgi:hypothetical protein
MALGWKNALLVKRKSMRRNLQNPTLISLLVLGDAELRIDRKSVLDLLDALDALRDIGRSPGLQVPDPVNGVNVVVHAGRLVDGVLGGNWHGDVKGDAGPSSVVGGGS